jgi:phage host-nuclease inhibitor protein Gam
MAADNTDIEREHTRLAAEQEELLREHERLEKNPHDAPGHVEHSRRLRAHIAALHAHIAALRKQ